MIYELEGRKVSVCSLADAVRISQQTLSKVRSTGKQTLCE